MPRDRTSPASPAATAPGRPRLNSQSHMATRPEARQGGVTAGLTFGSHKQALEGRVNASSQSGVPAYKQRTYRRLLPSADERIPYANESLGRWQNVPRGSHGTGV